MADGRAASVGLNGAADTLDRFVRAQDPVFEGVVEELRRGRKTSHWMWFVFPQLAGLGHSAMARSFAIASLDEARAYLRHPLLGARLRMCVAVMIAAPPVSAAEILGPVDALKFRSCLTLFALAAPEEGIFQSALDRFFEGQDDPATRQLLART